MWNSNTWFIRLKVPTTRNIFERRFGLTESEASTSAAYLLSGSVLLYPICGIIVDRMKRGSVVVQLLAIASVLTLLCFFWMTLPPALTLTPWPAIVCFGTAMGFAPRMIPPVHLCSRTLTFLQFFWWLLYPESSPSSTFLRPSGFTKAYAHFSSRASQY